ANGGGSGHAGTVNLSGSSLVISGGNLVLQANGSTLGTISVQTTAGVGAPPAGGDLTVGTGSGQFTVQATGTGALIKIQSGGDLTVSSPVSATNVTLIGQRNFTSNFGGTISGNQISITATTGAISLGDTVTGTGTDSSVTLSAFGSISNTAASTITADTLSASSTNGDIGTSGAHLFTAVSALTASAFGDAFIDNTSS